MPLFESSPGLPWVAACMQGVPASVQDVPSGVYLGWWPSGLGLRLAIMRTIPLQNFNFTSVTTVSHSFFAYYSGRTLSTAPGLSPALWCSLLCHTLLPLLFLLGAGHGLNPLKA